MTRRVRDSFFRSIEARTGVSNGPPRVAKNTQWTTGGRRKRSRLSRADRRFPGWSYPGNEARDSHGLVRKNNTRVSSSHKRLISEEFWRCHSHNRREEEPAVAEGGKEREKMKEERKKDWLEVATNDSRDRQVIHGRTLWRVLGSLPRFFDKGGPEGSPAPDNRGPLSVPWSDQRPEAPLRIR